MTKLPPEAYLWVSTRGIANNVGIGVSSSAFSGLVRPFVRWQRPSRRALSAASGRYYSHASILINVPYKKLDSSRPCVTADSDLGCVAPADVEIPQTA
ncbi:hypothetical protein HAX54_038537 [Datura stramonium]|uniref:Uncharacterized protein n=1 Tax=Datura stramonium TaxID=4076 RepID=A0ABS8VLB4_DATST|nr:hypothetical protein [Datura stramonium]